MIYHQARIFQRSFEILISLIIFPGIITGPEATWIKMQSTKYQYSLVSSKKSFTHAVKDCFEKEATLAMVKSDAELAFIESQVLSGLDENTWIGLYRFNGTWRFLDGTDLRLEAFVENPWFPGNHSDGSICTAIHADNLQWVDNLCSTKNYYICQKYPINHDCVGSDWFYVTWSPICYITMSNTLYVYSDALQLCHSNGYDIIMPKTQQQDSFLSWYIDDYLDGQPVWIGLTDKVEEGTFVWDDGELTNHTGWAPGQPDDKLLRQDCTVINTSNDTHYNFPNTWRDRSCSHPVPVICQNTRQEETIPLVPASSEYFSTMDDRPTTTEDTMEFPTKPSLAQCLCTCITNNLTNEEYLDIFYEYISKHLVVDKKSVSKNIRKQISVQDKRESAQQVGAFGISVYVLLGILMIVMDLLPRA